MKVLFLRAEVATVTAPLTSTHWLCDVPARALKRCGVEIDLRAVGDVYPGHPVTEWADVIVIERSALSLSTAILDAWRDAGKRVLLRFDDAYHKMPRWVPSWQQSWGLRHRGKPSIEVFTDWLGHFDSYSTPSKVLTSDFLEYNPNGVYIPNRPDLRGFPFPKDFQDKGPINLIWGGSVPHKQSWVDSGAVKAVNQAVDGDDVCLVLLCERPWFKELFTCGYMTTSWSPIDEYRKRLRLHGDVGLAPLAGEYDERRSWIKVLVYALLGIPWVASDIAPYEDCRGGLLIPNETEAWADSISDMVDSIFRMELRVSGLEWAWGCGIDRHISEWIDWLEGREHVSAT